MNMSPIITFTSDFGTREYYVAAVKGVILSNCPEARIVDISHQIRSHDLLEAAFTLVSAYPCFPARTIHLVVVDPGVGSSRRSIIAFCGNHLFVAPDNGVLSLVFKKEPPGRVIAIEAEHYYRQPVSPTFHGRDIFAPIVAQLARGVEASKLGSEINDYVRLNLPPARVASPGVVEGIVLHIDKFGNIITNITPQDLGEAGEGAALSKMTVNDRAITRHQQFYAEADSEEPFTVVGSSGHYEVAALKKPAARLLEVRRGMKVIASYE